MDSDGEVIPLIKLSISKASVDDLDELSVLFQAEFNEVGEQGLTLDINYGLLKGLMGVNAAAIYVVKHEVQIVGYMVFTIGSHPKYQSTRWAFGSGLWISPEYRRPRVAIRLMEFALEDLKNRGVNFIQMGSRVQHGAAGKLLEKFSFKPYEIGWLKQIS